MPIVGHNKAKNLPEMSFGKGMPRSTFEINLEAVGFGGVFELNRYLQTPRYKPGCMLRFSVVVLAKALLKVLGRSHVSALWVTQASN